MGLVGAYWSSCPESIEPRRAEIVFHVLNRGVGRQRLFHEPADYVVFEAIIAETLDQVTMRSGDDLLMPNH